VYTLAPAGSILIYVGYLFDVRALIFVGVLVLLVGTPALVQRLRRSGLPRLRPLGIAILAAVAVGLLIPVGVKELQPCGLLDQALERSPCLARIDQRVQQGDLRYSPDGSRLAVIAEGRATLYDTQTGRRLARYGSPDERVRAITFAPAAGGFALGLLDGRIQRYDATGTLLQTWQAHSEPGFVLLDFTPDGTRIVSAAGSEATLWDGAGTALARIVLPAPLETAALASGAPLTLIGAVADGNVLVQPLAADTAPTRYAAHPQRVSAVAAHPLEAMFATAGGDSTIKLWDLRTGDLLHTLSDGPRVIAELAFAGDGHRLVSGASDGTVQFWSVSGGALQETFLEQPGQIEALALHPAGASISVGVAPGLVDRVERRPNSGIRIEGQSVRAAEVVIWRIGAE
jgi:WD40 repeat protein